MSAWGIFSAGHYAGTDQGVDFSGAGPIPALDQATVTDVGHASIIEGGTYPYVVYRLNAGPYKGNFVYVAENFQPAVHKGESLKQGQSIGHAVGRYPYIEIGFNKTPAGWNAVAPLGGATAAGDAMKKYIYGLIGSAPPVTVPAGAGGFGTGVPVIGGVIGGVESTASFLGRLLDPHFWVRALQIVGGGLLLIMGLYLLAKEVGMAEPALPDPAEQAAKRAAIAGTFGEAAGIDTYKPEYRRSTEGVKRDVVKHEVSEQHELREARRQRVERAKAGPDFGDVPY